MNPVQQQTCRIISFLSPKGGTGKTTLIYSLAKQLVRTKRILLVDFDFSTAGLTHFLRGRSIESHGTGERTFEILEDLIGREVDSAGRVLCETDNQPIVSPLKIGNIHYLASVSSSVSVPIPGSGNSRSGLDRRHSSLPFSEGQLGKATRALFHLLRDCGNYDYVLVDTRGGMEEISLVTGFYSDFAVAVIDSTPVASNQLVTFRGRVLSVAQRFGVQFGPDDIPGYSVVICNKSNDVNFEWQRSRDTVQYASAKPLIGVIPFDMNVLLSAYGFDVPDILGKSEYAYHTAKCFADLFNRRELSYDEPTKQLYGTLHIKRSFREYTKTVISSFVLIIFLLSLLCGFWSIIDRQRVLEFIRQYQYLLFFAGVASAVTALGAGVYKWVFLNELIQPKFQRFARTLAAICGALAMARLGLDFYSALDITGLRSEKARYQDMSAKLLTERRMFSVDGKDGRLLRFEIRIEGCTSREVLFTLPNPELVKSNVLQSLYVQLIGDSDGVTCSILDRNIDESGAASIRMRITGSGEKLPGGRCSGSVKFVRGELRLPLSR